MEQEDEEEEEEAAAAAEEYFWLGGCSTFHGNAKKSADFSFPGSFGLGIHLGGLLKRHTNR